MAGLGPRQRAFRSLHAAAPEADGGNIMASFDDRTDEQQARRRAAFAAGLPLVRVRDDATSDRTLTSDERAVLNALTHPMRPAAILDTAGVTKVAGARAIAKLMRRGYIDVADDPTLVSERRPLPGSSDITEDGLEQEGFEEQGDRTLEERQLPPAVLAVLAEVQDRGLEFAIPADEEGSFGARAAAGEARNSPWVIPDKGRGAAAPPVASPRGAPQVAEATPGVRPYEATPSPALFGRASPASVEAPRQNPRVWWLVAGGLFAAAITLALLRIFDVL